jgi:hypothetical protein
MFHPISFTLGISGLSFRPFVVAFPITVLPPRSPEFRFAVVPQLLLIIVKVGVRTDVRFVKELSQGEDTVLANDDLPSKFYIDELNF